MNQTISKMYTIQQQISILEAECTLLGKEAFGDSFEGCYFNEDELVVYIDCGHDTESDEMLFNEYGEEI